MVVAHDQIHVDRADIHVLVRMRTKLPFFHILHRHPCVDLLLTICFLLALIVQEVERRR